MFSEKVSVCVEVARFWSSVAICSKVKLQVSADVYDIGNR